MEMEKGQARALAARRCFENGGNCAQAVLAAFAEDYGLDVDTALRLSAPFGGGIGRTRGLCGAVSGMLMAAGLRWGRAHSGDAQTDVAQKLRMYQIARELMAAFAEENGSTICRELLEGKKCVVSDEAVPEERTTVYYQKRPCAEYVAYAAALLEGYEPHD